MKKFTSRLLIFLFFICSLQVAEAWSSSRVLVLRDGEGVRSLAGYLYVYADSGGDVPFEKIASPEFADNFTLLPGALSAGFTASTYWLRFTITGRVNAASEIWLEFYPPFTDYLTLYKPFQDENGKTYFKAVETGDHLSFESRDVNTNMFVFRLAVPDRDEATYYLRISTQSTMAASLTLYTPDVFVGKKGTENLLFGAFYGILGIIILINTFFWFYLREDIYLKYLCYLVSIFANFLCANDFIKQYFFQGPGEMADLTTGISMSLAIMTAGFFFSGLLRMPQYFPVLNKVSRLMSFSALTGIVAVLLGKWGVVSGFLHILFLLMTLLFFVVCTYGLIKKFPIFGIYFVGFSIHFISITLVGLRNIGVLEPGFLTNWGFAIGTATHMIFMSLGLADRVRLIEKEKREAQVMSLEKERTERELANERRLSRAQRHFFSMVTHEFKTPLSIIDRAVQMIGFKLQNPEPGVVSRLDVIRGSTHRLLGLIDACLNDQVLESGFLKKNFISLNIVPMLRTLCNSYGYAGGKANIELVLPEVGLPDIQGNEELLYFVFGNLIDNAIKFSPDGGNIFVKAENSGENIVVSVRDSGIGIPEHELNEIGTRFFRASSGKDIPGAGIGLHSVRQIVKTHGGKFEIESTLGVGTSARIILPY